MALNKLRLFSLLNQSITDKMVDRESLSHRRLARGLLSIRRTTDEVYFLVETIIHHIGIHSNNFYKYQAIFLQGGVFSLILLEKTLCLSLSLESLTDLNIKASVIVHTTINFVLQAHPQKLSSPLQLWGLSHLNSNYHHCQNKCSFIISNPNHHPNKKELQQIPSNLMLVSLDIRQDAFCFTVIYAKPPGRS